MKNISEQQKNFTRGKQAGIVLLVTLVLLVVLSTLGYTMSSRIAARRHRDRYIIDYSNARYSCDSALKYALATLQDINPQLISRPNEPDFSDLFILSQAECRKLWQQWLAQTAADSNDGVKSIGNAGYTGSAKYADKAGYVGGAKSADSSGEVNDVNDMASDKAGPLSFSGTDTMPIPGPYGPPWPDVTEPAELMIGSSKVRIEIEDENAKYPVGWMMQNDPLVQREIEAGFETFCEWMKFGRNDIDTLRQQLQQIAAIKPFQLKFEPLKTTVKVPTRDVLTRSVMGRTTLTVEAQATRQNADFARLLHSSLIDREKLARPYIEGREESALKYICMWASQKVNINTAPRHVLEAVFAFGSVSDAPKIAQAVIQQRRIEPFNDIETLKQSLLEYSDSIGKCEPYITTVSQNFTIKITAVCGVAKASAVAAIIKDSGRTTIVAVISS